MLNDITLGQFFPGHSLLHRMDPRMKLILAVLYITLIFMAKTLLSLLFVALLTILLPFLGKISFGTVMKAIKPLRIVLVIMLILFLLTGSKEGEHTIWEASWGFLHLYFSVEGILRAFAICLRIVLLVVSSAVILSYTTSPIAMADGIESLLYPLTFVKVPVHDFAMMLTIAMRFIPILLEETSKIMAAQSARGADFKNGSLIRRAKALIPIFIPLFTSSIRHADNLATAMVCRCYHGGKGRTCMKTLRYAPLDYLVLFVMGLLMVGLLAAVGALSGLSALPYWLNVSFL